MTDASSLHAMFRAACLRTPDAVALVAGETLVSYRELDRRAAGLAARLSALGVGPETPVGVRLGRSLDLVVALLAVLRAGGVYVPVEPASRRTAAGCCSPGAACGCW